MPTVQVRYIVTDVDAALAFYTRLLGFTEVMHPAPTFALLSNGDLRLALTAPNPQAGGGQPMPDGDLRSKSRTSRPPSTRCETRACTFATTSSLE